MPDAARWTTVVAGALFLLQGIVYTIFVLGIRNRETSSFGGVAFWAAARPVMAVLALATSALLFVGTSETVKFAGVVQGADIAVGISLFLAYRDYRLVHPPPSTAV